MPFRSCALRFSGFIFRGLPHGMCSLRWPDGTELHAEFVDGEPEGFARFIWADGAEFRGILRSGLPGEGFLHPRHGDVRRVANMAECSPGTPLWQMDAAEVAAMMSALQELPLSPFVWSRCDALALVHVIPRNGPNAHNFDHLKRVTARLTWARPVHGDQPLWNRWVVARWVWVWMRV
jgi:hypothetical protein